MSAREEKRIRVKDTKKLGKLLASLEEYGFTYGFTDFFGKITVVVKGDPVYFYRNLFMIKNNGSELSINRDENKKVISLPEYTDFYYYYPDRELGLILFDGPDE
jgi:hypothetical protein